MYFKVHVLNLVHALPVASTFRCTGTCVQVLDVDLLLRVVHKKAGLQAAVIN